RRRNTTRFSTTAPWRTCPRTDSGIGWPAITPAILIIRSVAASDISFHRRVAIHLQVRRWPLFIHHAKRDLGISPDCFRLSALSHRRDQNVVAVHHVVDDRHRRPIVLATVTKYARAMRADKFASFLGRHGVFSWFKGFVREVSWRAAKTARDVARASCKW